MTTQISGDTGVSAVQPGVVAQGDLAANVAGNGPVVLLTMSGAQSVPLANTDYTVAFDVKDDPTNIYNTTTKRLTIQVTGYYLICMNTQLTSASTNVAHRLYVSESPTKYITYVPYSSVYAVSSTVVKLTAGNVVGLIINTGSVAGNSMVTAATNTYASLCLIRAA